MFKFLRVVVLLGLFAAVAGFGLKIYLASSRMDTTVATDTSKLKESLKESVKKAKKLAKETRKQAETIKKTLDILKEKQLEAKQKKSAIDNSESKAAKEKSLGPVDAEDAKLTAEVLNSSPQKTKRKSKPEKPFDFERVSKIQKLYTQAARALSLD